MPKKKERPYSYFVSYSAKELFSEKVEKFSEVITSKDMITTDEKFQELFTYLRKEFDKKNTKRYKELQIINLNFLHKNEETIVY